MAHSAKRKFSNPTIDAALSDKVRDTVRGMRNDVSPTYTLRQFCEEAFDDLCRKLEQQYNDGRSWPHVDEPLGRGRPGR